MLSVIYAECHKLECCYAECRYTDCRGAKTWALTNQEELIKS
jgi:hypothetical protein